VCAASSTWQWTSWTLSTRHKLLRRPQTLEPVRPLLPAPPSSRALLERSLTRSLPLARSQEDAAQEAGQDRHVLARRLARLERRTLAPALVRRLAASSRPAAAPVRVARRQAAAPPPCDILVVVRRQHAPAPDADRARPALLDLVLARRRQEGLGPTVAEGAPRRPRRTAAASPGPAHRRQGVQEGARRAARRRLAPRRAARRGRQLHPRAHRHVPRGRQEQVRLFRCSVLWFGRG